MRAPAGAGGGQVRTFVVTRARCTRRIPPPTGLFLVAGVENVLEAAPPPVCRLTRRCAAATESVLSRQEPAV